MNPRDTAIEMAMLIEAKVFELQGLLLDEPWTHGKELEARGKFRCIQTWSSYAAQWGRVGKHK